MKENKTIKFTKKYDIDVVIIILLLITPIIFCTYMGFEDELWNFANTYKIYNGYKVYKDINIIITPLFFYIAQIFFKLFGPTLLSFRIYNVAITTIFFILIYKIIKQLKIPRRRGIFYIILFIYLYRGTIAAGANYNYTAVLPILTQILLILKNKNSIFSSGILLVITFLLKQNIFCFFALGIFLYIISSKDKSIKEKIKELISIYAITFVGIFLFLLFLFINQNLYNFISCCFLGLKEFGQTNIAINIYDARLIYISIIMIIFECFIIKNKKTKKFLNAEVICNSKMLICFGSPCLLIAYPIFNYYHSILGSLIILISFIYIMEKSFLSDIVTNVKKEKVVYSAILIIFIIWNIYIILVSMYKLKSNNISIYKSGPYVGIMYNDSQEENLERICNYIEDKKQMGIDVKILSYKANFYVTKLKTNNGKFDLDFRGNLGKNGEQGLIEEIKKMKNTYILIATEEKNIFEQESELAINYVKNNYTKLEEVEEYSVYKIN